MRRFYTRLGYRLDHFRWGRAITGHVRAHSRFYENVDALFTALLLALLIKRYFFEAYKIPSGSMRETLQVNDRIFVNKFIYDLSDINVGDIVVFRTPDNIYSPDKPYYIKRVVGLPGDLIRIHDGRIYRNGKPLDQPHFFAENRYTPYLKNNRAFRPIRVPEGQIFVLGDNSQDSYDSRYWGCVPIENVMGKAVFRYWPPTRIGLIKDVPVPTDGFYAEESRWHSRDAHAAGQIP